MDIRMVIMDDKLLPSGHCHRDTNAEDTVKRKTVLELKKENVL